MIKEAIITAKKSLISDLGESISGRIEKKELKKMSKIVNIELANNPRFNKKKIQTSITKKLNKRCAFQCGINSLKDYPSICCNCSIWHRKNRVNV